LYLLGLCWAIALDSQQLRTQPVHPESLSESGATAKSHLTGSGHGNAVKMVERQEDSFSAKIDGNARSFKNRAAPQIDAIYDRVENPDKSMKDDVKDMAGDSMKLKRKVEKDFLKMNRNLVGLRALELDAGQTIQDRHDLASSYISDISDHLTSTWDDSIDHAAELAHDQIESGTEVTEEGVELAAEEGSDIMETAEENLGEMTVNMESLQDDFGHQWADGAAQIAEIDKIHKKQQSITERLEKSEEKVRGHFKNINNAADRAVVREIDLVQKATNKATRDVEAGGSHELAASMKDGKDLIKEYAKESGEAIAEVKVGAEELASEHGRNMQDFKSETSSAHKDMLTTLGKLRQTVVKSEDNVAKTQALEEKESAKVEGQIDANQKATEAGLDSAETSLATAEGNAKRQRSKIIAEGQKNLDREGKTAAGEFASAADEARDDLQKSMDEEEATREASIGEAEEKSGEINKLMKHRAAQVSQLYKEQVTVENEMAGMPAEAQKELKRRNTLSMRAVERASTEQDRAMDKIKGKVDPLMEHIEVDAKAATGHLKEMADNAFYDLKTDGANDLKGIADPGFDPAMLPPMDTNGENLLKRAEETTSNILPLIQEGEREGKTVERALDKAAQDSNYEEIALADNLEKQMRGFAYNMESGSKQMLTDVKIKAMKEKMVVEKDVKGAMRQLTGLEAKQESAANQVKMLNDGTKEQANHVNYLIKTAVDDDKGEVVGLRGEWAKFTRNMNGEVGDRQAKENKGVSAAYSDLTNSLEPVLDKAHRDVSKILDSTESSMDRAEKFAASKVDSMVAKSQDDTKATATGIGQLRNELGELRSGTNSFGSSSLASQKEFSNSLTGMVGDLDQETALDRQSVADRERETKNDALHIESDINSRLRAGENQIDAQARGAAAQARALAGGLESGTSQAMSSDAGRVGHFDHNLDAEMGRSQKNAGRLTGSASQVSGAIDGAAASSSKNAAQLGSDFRSGKTAAGYALSQGVGASNGGMSGQVDNAEALANEMHNLDGATNDAIGADRREFDANMARVNGGLNSAVASEKQKADQFGMATGRIEDEGKGLEPGLKNAALNADQMYRQMKGEIVSEEDKQNAVLNAEVNKHTHASLDIKTHFKEVADIRLHDLLNLADKLAAAKHLSDSGAKHSASKEAKFQDYVDRTAKLQFSHSIQEVDKLTDDVQTSDFSSGDLTRWLHNFRAYDSGFNRKVHDKLKELGADIDADIFKNMQDVVKEQMSLEAAGQREDAGFLKSMGLDRSSNHDKVASLMLASDTSINDIMNNDKLTKEQKEQLIAELRARSKRLAAQLLAQQGDLKTRNAQLEAGLVGFQALCDFARGRAFTGDWSAKPGSAHAQIGTNLDMVNEGLVHLRKTYPFLDVVTPNKLSLVEVDSSQDVEGLATADDELAVSDAEMEKKIERLERMTSI